MKEEETHRGIIWVQEDDKSTVAAGHENEVPIGIDSTGQERKPDLAEIRERHC